MIRIVSTHPELRPIPISNLPLSTVRPRAGMRVITLHQRIRNAIAGYSWANSNVAFGLLEMMRRCIREV